MGDLIDFTLSNARRFYSSKGLKGEKLGRERVKGPLIIIERLSLTFTANGKKKNFCRLSSALCTVESKYLYLQ